MPGTLQKSELSEKHGVEPQEVTGDVVVVNTPELPLKKTSPLLLRVGCP